jgi:FkbM family methyltransferase
MISYAQNFEDVILWRALKHVDRGFYIDIGAQDPVVDSVSLAFYEKGWRGVHVEPTAFYAAKLRGARPDETVIQAAIGTSGKSIEFWEFPDTGLSTGIREIATIHERGSHNSVCTNVPCIRLSELLSDYRGKDIHWLKIDVEGMEREVIGSWLPAQARPWIVVVESTKPNSPEPAFAEWEPLLVEIGYEFVYFDGLNRFYISREHTELKKHFGPGPNYFDDFTLSGKANSPFCARINAETASLREQTVHLSKRADDLSSQVLLQTQTFAKAVAAWENAQAALSLQHSEREKNVEDLTAWAKSLEADLRAKTEAFAAQDADLVRKTDALMASAACSKLLQSRLLAETEALTAGNTRAKSLEADLIAKAEALAAREAALARTSETLMVSDIRARALEADLLARNEALADVFASTSMRITAPLRSGGRAARWFIRGSIAWLMLRPGSRPRRVLRHLRMTLFSTDRSRAEPSKFLQHTHDESVRAITFPLNTQDDNPTCTCPTNTRKSRHGKVEALANLSSHACNVFAEIKAALAMHEGRH